MVDSDNNIFNEKPIREPVNMKILPNHYLKQFRAYYPKIVKEITDGKLITDINAVNDRIALVMDYTVPNGRQTRGSIFIASYNFITGKNWTSEDERREIYLLAWCIELLTSYILIIDDILDNSEKRRGKTSWFKIDTVGLNALNDATLIQMSIFKLLYKQLSNHAHYKELVNVFVEATLKTAVGQLMDCDNKNFELFTMNRFNEIAINKTGYYCFYFPVVLAMFASNRPDLDFHQSGLEVFKDLGIFYQLQNDYMDCYVGNSGSDIQEKKCSWLLAKALEKASPEQKEILVTHCGKWDTNSVDNVKQVYEELGLRKSFSSEVEESYKKINEYINTNVKHETSRKLLKRLTQVCLGYKSYLLRE
ncbi:hypothetical protein WA026_015720 [Henosepilachna vigintioctopunctata]